MAPPRPSAVDSPYLAALRSRVLVFDGAMGTSLQSCALTPESFGGAHLEGWIDGLTLFSPDVVRGIHRSFLEVGCDVVETNSFQATPLRLAEWQNAERAHELNAEAASLARELCAEFSTPEKPRFVAGSMGPSGFLPSSDDPSLGNVRFADLVEAFRVQARGLVEGGADLLIVETQQDILETRAAIFGARAAFVDLGRAVPVQAQVSLDVSGRMLLGTDIGAVLTILEALRVDVVGLNCSTGPEHMREPIRWLCEHTRLPVSCIPNAGLPRNVGGNAVYNLAPGPMADELSRFVTEFGVNVVGGCCGTTPEHLGELVSRVSELAAVSLGADAPGGGSPPTPAFAAGVRPNASVPPSIASATRSVTIRQEPAPLLIGERVNAQGSRRMKRLLLADDYDGILEIAREQVESGAHALDVQVALTERTDEAEQMRLLVRKLQMAVETPLVIDTTEADVVRAALETYPGRCVINSINLEDGRTRADAFLPMIRDHGAGVIALTIDRADDIGGMAKTRHTKLLAAQRIHAIAVGEYGLHPSQLLFDALTFTLATGQEEYLDSAVETIEGIRLIKQALPGVNTTLGLSNVSFGFSPAARPLLNSVFLYHCVEAGLDTVIINPAHVLPYFDIPADQRELAEDLIFNRRPDALPRFIAWFEENAGAAQQEEREDPFAGMAPPERIHQQILHRRKDGIEEQIDLALLSRGPVEVLNDILLPAMKDVGDRFGAGELILPFVLQSAEVMKRAVAHLEQFLEKKEGYTKGKVVLATVYGDVHDIGKNLVNTILTNNGYTVYDLGKQVPLNTIIDKAVEVSADAIALSALLVSTSKQMSACVRELDARGLSYPVLVGGAAINRGFGRRILFVEDERAYGPGVFYCKDAFEGLETIDALVDPAQREGLVSRIVTEAHTQRETDARKAEARAALPVSNGARPARSETRTDVPIPLPPFWGARVVRGIDPRAVYPFIDRNSLYKMSWQFRGIRDEQRWEALLREELEPRLQRCMDEVERDGYLDLQAVYGYWPSWAEGDDVVIFDPADRSREIGRFHFPRQSEQNRLCLADYVRPREAMPGDERDVVALQIVTVGPEATERSNALQVSGDYDDMLRVHGFSTQMAEATAEYVHGLIRSELSLGDDQGRRYSWGYPACPDLEDHRVLFGILPAEEIGVSLTEGFQLVPEQSTAAIVMHHPQARYFAVYTAASAPDDAGELVGRGTPEPVR
ncbi:MAG TPA: methionine synthase [Candidatus Angelobacter sp.]|jgi:5-methyltetrahydrofolate--homocysteine methyltransferase|nr:methionine synthase [Candidatus Angelobacter sp.]